MADQPESRGEAHLIEHLVGSVLGSVVKAQGLAASQLIDMVESIGFTRQTDGSLKTRTFEFNFFRTEVDPELNTIVRRPVTASVPLLTLINLPSIAIQEARIEMDLRLVAHEQSSTDPEGGPMKLFVVPARKQLVRTAEQAFAIDSAGTIRLSVTMRQEPAVGLDKLQSLLESGTEERIKPPESQPG